MAYREGAGARLGLVVMAAVWLGGTSVASAGDCVDHGLTVEALSEALAKDSAIKGMNPWALQSVVFEPCAVAGELPVVLTFGSPAKLSKLGLTYQLVLSAPFDVVKQKVGKMDPPPSRTRGDLEKSIRSLEKDPLAAGVAAAAPAAGGIAYADGRIELVVPEWGEAPAVEWTGTAVQRAHLAGTVEVPAHPQVVAFRAVAPSTLIEGKDCGLPQTYDMVQDGRDWLFQFALTGACKGEWVLRLAEDGTVTSEKE